MASVKENNINSEEEEERAIPVFTVLKNGNVFKNIFVLHDPSFISQPSSPESVLSEKKSANREGKEEVLIVGRHPDCNIVLEHPSISRFHLQIDSNPSLKKLSVTDLSSAHGTWVSDRKIEPQVRVELNERDTLRLGASTRIYRLHWLPISRAFDLENPFLSPVIEDPEPAEAIEEEEEEAEKEQEEEKFLNENQILLSELPSAPPMPENMNSCSFDEDDEILLEAIMQYEKENQKSPLRRLSKNEASESVNSSCLPNENVLLETIKTQFDKENQENTEFDLMGKVLSEREIDESPQRVLEQKLDVPSLWSRRGKPNGLISIQTCRSREKSRTARRKDVGINPENQNEGKDDKVAKALFFSDSDREEETFIPDKENFTPGPKSMKKSFGPQSIDRNQDQEEGMLAFSEKENMTPVVLRGSKSKKPLGSGTQVRQETEMIMNKRQVGRVPFQSLISNVSKKKSEAPVAAGSTNSVNCSQIMEKNSHSFSKKSVGEANRVWNMVVDTSCLLSKDSRRSLQLLQGLKGTCLIIPRMVIRELDSLKRRNTLFRRDTEVCSVLQWIEECMVTTQWWIHVQNSEEDIPVPATPPASPLSRTSEGTTGVLVSSMPFSTCGSLMEIVSPTAEDHILESALLFRRIKRNEQLVLLTNSVALKIKAMAEGLICDTAEEFRESIVNPWSERFMWSESTPRGPTWSSCSGEVGAGLRENYYQFPTRKTARAAESAKGLKLILLHNSHYGQMHSVN